MTEQLCRFPAEIQYERPLVSGSLPVSYVRRKNP